MRVHRSNDMSVLIDALAEFQARPGLRPLERAPILIQSAGMERYLSRELTERLGVTFGLDFPYPRAFLEATLARALGEEAGPSGYERDELTFRIFRILGHLDHPDLRPYLAGDRFGVERLLLSERLAHLFDQYITYRPRMLERWQRDGEPDFQSELWRRLVAELGPRHFAARAEALFAMNPAELEPHLPRRLAVVGGPGLPPLFLSLLSHLARATDVEVFSFTVCSEYFADAHPHDDPLPEVGQGLHPLLVQMGRVGGDYQALLEMIGYEEGKSHFVSSRGATLLGLLQSDIVEGRVRPEAERVGRELLEDGSIRIVSCHSALREVEILRDHLLDLFHRDATLGAEDVVVLTPEVQSYAPLIRAVFGGSSSEGQFIPFRVADQSARRESPAIEALLRVLELLGGRMKASAVLDVLKAEPVRARLGIEVRELERITEWVMESGARWGFDAEHRAELGFMTEAQNTWKFGIQRLLLGFTMADDDVAFDGIVPMDDVAGAEGELLGRLVEFVGVLIQGRERLGQAATPREFATAVRWLCLELLADDDHADLAPIFEIISEFAARAERASVDEPIGVGSLTRLLEHELMARRSSTDFLAGGVTFCELLPLRSIPFRVICVLGLNQLDFPRADRVISLNRLAASRQRGDRSLREEDRYLFLEMLLSARDQLYLSYIGRSIQDNAHRSPSVLLSELCQAIEETVEKNETPAEVVLTREHRLQPFHPSYFLESAPARSYSVENFRAAIAQQALATGAGSARDFLELGAVPGDDTSLETLELAELEGFFRNPARAYLRGLGVRIDDEIALVLDREPVQLSALGRFELGRTLLEKSLRGRLPSAEIELARGVYPLGNPGRTVEAEVREEVLALSRVREGLAAGFPRRDREVDVEVRGARLLGRVTSTFGERHILTEFGALDPARRLRGWLRHLALAASGYSYVTFLIGRSGHDPEVERFEALSQDEGIELLGDFVDVLGKATRVPLRFDVAAAFSALKKWSSPRLSNVEQERLVELRKAAEKELFPRQRGLDPSVELLFGAADPLGFTGGYGVAEEVPFLVLSQRLLGPLLQRLVPVRIEPHSGLVAGDL